VIEPQRPCIKRFFNFIFCPFSCFEGRLFPAATFQFIFEKEEKKSSAMGRVVTVSMDPEEAPIDIDRTALLIIDMQRDFLEPGGFGEALGNDVSKLQRAVEPCQKLLASARKLGMLVIHTREGHRSDLADLHPNKYQRRGSKKDVVIGTLGPLGRIMVRGEEGHDIIPALYPIPGEPIIDKPGKGSFYATDLECILRARQIDMLLVCGVTTEVCVHTTIREANDRGLFCICVADCCASYFDEFHAMALKMISAQGGIFGYVSESPKLIEAFDSILEKG
jgi:nicotinamidase-related amidase